MLVKILSKFNCQAFPIDETAIEVSQEVLDQIGITKCFDVEKNKVIPYDNTEDLLNEKKEELRLRREPLLIAFDKYKTNVIYGIEEETTEEKIEVLEWYQKALNLDEDAIENVPDKIKYYL